MEELAYLPRDGGFEARLTYQRAAERKADVTVSFHWLTAMATVVLPGREPLRAAYHLVLANRGPASARQVDLKVSDPSGRPLSLLDVAPGEFPLEVLDDGSRYPIPWLFEPFTPHARRFRSNCVLARRRGPP
jgi:hypothetical protein